MHYKLIFLTRLPSVNFFITHLLPHFSLLSLSQKSIELVVISLDVRMLRNILRFLADEVVRAIDTLPVFIFL